MGQMAMEDQFGVAQWSHRNMTGLKESMQFLTPLIGQLGQIVDRGGRNVSKMGWRG